MSDSERYRATQAFSLVPGVVQRDFILLRDDGSWLVVRAGTVISAPTLAGPMRLERVASETHQQDPEQDSKN